MKTLTRWLEPGAAKTTGRVSLENHDIEEIIEEPVAVEETIDVAPIEDNVAELDDVVEETATLEAYSDLLKSAQGRRSQNISPAVVRAIEIGLGNTRILGGQQLVSNEAYDDMTVSVELMDKIRGGLSRGYERVKEIIRAIIEFLKNAWENLTYSVEDYINKLDQLTKAATHWEARREGKQVRVPYASPLYAANDFYGDNVRGVQDALQNVNKTVENYFGNATGFMDGLGRITLDNKGQVPRSSEVSRALNSMARKIGLTTIIRNGNSIPSKLGSQGEFVEVHSSDLLLGNKRLYVGVRELTGVNFTGVFRSGLYNDPKYAGRDTVAYCTVPSFEEVLRIAEIYKAFGKGLLKFEGKSIAGASLAKQAESLAAGLMTQGYNSFQVAMTVGIFKAMFARTSVDFYNMYLDILRAGVRSVAAMLHGDVGNDPDMEREMNRNQRVRGTHQGELYEHGGTPGIGRDSAFDRLGNEHTPDSTGAIATTPPKPNDPRREAADRITPDMIYNAPSRKRRF